MAASANMEKVSVKDFRALAQLLEGSGLQRVHKKAPHAEAVRSAAAAYEGRDYVAAYEAFRPIYDKLLPEMRRVATRNIEFEANKLARDRHMNLAAAKASVQKATTKAQQMIDQLDRLLRDLEIKPLVRNHLRKGTSPVASSPGMIDKDRAADFAGSAAAPLAPAGASGIAVDASEAAGDDAADVVVDGTAYRRGKFAAPEVGSLYTVRDKSKGDRLIRILAKSPDGAAVQVELLQEGKGAGQPLQLAVEALARQGAKGWCARLLPKEENETKVAEGSSAAEDSDAGAPGKGASQPPPAGAESPITEVHAPTDDIQPASIHVDIQNFGRCCADIQRAKIAFDIQLIKDVGDGPFRAGNFEQAFLSIEQLAPSFSTAVSNIRQGIANGRRELTAEKGRLSGKEIQERTAALVRSEQLLNTAQRSFSTILEGLRVYLRAQQAG